jgi:hypothetical protein
MLSGGKPPTVGRKLLPEPLHTYQTKRGLISEHSNVQIFRPYGPMFSGRYESMSLRKFFPTSLERKKEAVNLSKC